MTWYKILVLTFGGAALLAWSEGPAQTEKALDQLMREHPSEASQKPLSLIAIEGVRRGSLAQALSKEQILSPQIQDTVRQLYALKLANGGVGIAAPQVGMPLQIILVRVLPEDRPLFFGRQDQVMFNPQIHSSTDSDDAFHFPETCLSLPGTWRLVPRASRVRVSYLDLEGQPQMLSLSGRSARVVQHEVDHLNGKLIDSH